MVPRLLSIGVSRVNPAPHRARVARLPQHLSEYQAAHALERVPSPLAWASYLFCCGNLLAGPHFEYSEYEQFIELKGVSRRSDACVRYRRACSAGFMLDAGPPPLPLTMPICGPHDVHDSRGQTARLSMAERCVCVFGGRGRIAIAQSAGMNKDTSIPS